ncbi:MAG: hypothetical protein QME58_02370 [Bacteroidota bacterium]|nr:hypothetical protein [Bacteroidota bacterium]
MIISIALLGFGASGTFLHFIRDKIFKNFETAIFWACLACSSWMVLSIFVLHFIHFDPFLLIWDLTKLWTLVIFYLMIMLPFFFGAIVICSSFIKYSEQINKIYFFNLFGSAFGGIGVLVLMFYFEPFHIPEIVALVAFIATVLSFSMLKMEKKFVTPLVLNSGIIFLGWVLPFEIQTSEYKSLAKTKHLMDAKIVDEKFSPFGQLTTISSTVLRFAPGLSLNYTGEIPVQTGLFSDGDWVGGIIQSDSNKDFSFLKYTTSALPYQLVKSGDVLVIGVGTGTEIRTALQNGNFNVDGVELNSQVTEISKVNFPKEKVNIIIGEGRGYLNQTKMRYSVIAIPILEGFSSSAAGIQSIFENYLLTIESFKLMLSKLSEEGILAISVWTNYPPRHSIKMFAALVESLEESGIKNPSLHIAGIRSWSTATLIVRKTPFTSNDIDNIKIFCEKNSFDPIYYPTITDKEINRYNQVEEDLYYKSALKILSAEQRKFFDEYNFYIEPPNDDKPYFSHFIKFKSLPYLREILGNESVAFMELGFFILLLTLIQIVLISFILIIIPLIFLLKEENTRNSKFATLIYFGGLGSGFMLIEIVFIQKFILFLSHPIYSVSVVITSLLLFSGIGSYYSTIFLKNVSKKLQFILILIIITAAGYSILIPGIFNYLVHLPVVIKYLISFLIIAPIAFLMGMPFPIGMSLLARRCSNLVPWAWGINGYLSVVSAIAAPLLAMEFGFQVVIVIASIMYLVALISNQERRTF